jgi:HsdM N-terminal domain
MLTGELRNQIDRIWDAFWSGGIANPLEVMEQLTYLLFIKRLDDLHLKAHRVIDGTCCQPVAILSSRLMVPDIHRPAVESAVPNGRAAK